MNRPRLRWISRLGFLFAWLVSLDREERDWIAAYLLAHVYIRYADDVTAHAALEKLYHRMHFGAWET